MTKEEITKTIKNTIKLVKQNNEINNSVIIANILDIQLELNELQRENKRLKHSLEVGESQYNDLVEEKEKLMLENEMLKMINSLLDGGK